MNLFKYETKIIKLYFCLFLFVSLPRKYLISIFEVKLEENVTYTNSPNPTISCFDEENTRQNILSYLPNESVMD